MDVKPGADAGGRAKSKKAVPQSTASISLT